MVVGLGVKGSEVTTYTKVCRCWLLAMSHLPKAAAVLYHYPCPDGAFAALAAHLYLRATSTPTLFFPNRVYSPVFTHHLSLPRISHLFLLDFVGPPDFLPQVSPAVPQVTVLDHHKTALQLLRSWNHPNVHKVIDMGRSGATIAFDYFKQRAMEEGLLEVAAEFERVRRVFEYVEDGDLWRWGLQNSKAFSSGLKDMKLEFDVGLNPSLFDLLLSLDVETLINEGMASLSKKQMLIDEALEQSYQIALGGGTFGNCLAVNADSISELRSELGHQLANKSRNLKLRGIGAVVYRVPELKNDQSLKISLRSVDDEDTTIISREYGGGGHQSASSFMLSSAEFDKWKV